MKKQKQTKDLLLEKFEYTVKSGIKFEGKLEDINYFKTFTKADTKKQIFKLYGCNVCMLNYEDYVLMIFSVPIRSSAEGDENRHVSDRLMDIVRNIEETFVNVDSMTATEVKEDKTIYLTVLKKVEKQE